MPARTCIPGGLEGSLDRGKRNLPQIAAVATGSARKRRQIAAQGIAVKRLRAVRNWMRETRGQRPWFDPSLFVVIQ